ncbi:MAG: DUF2304 domain-containing protein [Solirubrobacteraceae bacterium]
MHFGARVASIAFALLVFAFVFEMVRRRYLRERYAILWLGAALVLLVLATWTQLLRAISNAVGIATPSNAFFVIAFAFLLLLVLHFSAVVSRLSDESRVLAQRLALLEQRQRATEDAGTSGGASHEEDWVSPTRASKRRPRAGTKP